MELKTESDLEQLVRNYQDPLLRYCTGILGNHEDAEDAVQSAFIKAWKKRNSLKNKDMLKTWLYRIAYCAAVDILRARKNTEAFSEELADEFYMEEENGLSEEIAAVLGSLSILDRAIVEERILEEMPYEEMAKIHHMSTAALRRRYSRAREKLKKLLSEEENHEK